MYGGFGCRPIEFFGCRAIELLWMFRVFVVSQVSQNAASLKGTDDDIKVNFIF